jgi:hypothetical protein
MAQDIDNVLNLLSETLKRANVQGVKDIAENGLKTLHTVMDNSLLTAEDRAKVAAQRDEILKKLENLNDVCNNFK